MTKTASRRSKATSDFKRIKAKVGKRAIKPANVTDTSFKSAALVVRKQDVGVATTTATTNTALLSTAAATATDAATTAVLYSAKGKSLQELSAQLSHPASNVRISAVKGMQAIVGDFPQLFVSRYYYLLFPAMAKCLVDTDPMARQLSRSLLQNVLSQALLPPSSTLTPSASSSPPLSGLLLVRPYIPLVLAYILSALNSLDRVTRMDGAKSLIVLFQKSHHDGNNNTITTHDNMGDKDAASDSSSSSSLFLVENDDIERLLPALVGLMSTDHHSSQQLLQQPPSKKKSKKASSMESDRCIILQSLVSVLKSVTFSQSKNNHTILHGSNLNASCRYVKNDSVVLLRRSFDTLSPPPSSSSHNTLKVSRISDLLPFSNRQDNISSNGNTLLSWNDNTTIKLPTSVMLDLISKLCDHLVETTQTGGGLDDGIDPSVNRQQQQHQRTMMGKYAAEELYLVVTAIQLVWRTCGPISNFDNQNQPNDQKVNEQLMQYIKQWKQLLSLLLEVFPVLSQDHSSSSNDNNGLSLCERLNLTLCTTIMEISSAMMQLEDVAEHASSTSTTAWIGPLLEYLLPRVERESDATRSNSSVVHTLAKLLLLKQHGHDGKWLLSSKKRLSIMECLQNFLIGTSNDNDQQQQQPCEESRVRSPAGRRVVQLLRDMVTELCHLDPFQQQQEEDNELNKRVLAMTFQIPLYLKAWRGDFPLDSYSILTLLVDVVRRISPETSDPLKKQFVQDMRQGLAALFLATTTTATATTTGSSTRKRKSTLESSVGSCSRSIFEQYPVVIQRQLMGLLSLLQSPTPDTISSLSIICARGGGGGGTSLDDSGTIASEMEDFVVQVLHNIRRTISMPSYLGFLVQSTGVLTSHHANVKISTKAVVAIECDGKESNRDPRNRVQWTTDDSTLVLSHDRKIRRTCWYLTDCAGGLKILPVLHPVLVSLLSNVSASDKNPILFFTLRARAAVAMLAWLAHDIQLFNDPQSSILVTLPDLQELLLVALCRLLETLPVAEADGDALSCAVADSLLRPVIALLQREPLLLKLIFLRQLSEMRNTPNATQTCLILEKLSSIIQDPVIREALKSYKDDLVATIGSIEKECEGGPSESTARNLRFDVENILS